VSDAPGVSILLSTHCRLKNLARQIAAVQAQTVRPATVAIWHDGPFPPPQGTGLPVVASNTCLGVWPRMYFCGQFETEFVAVLDDDTIPGPRWLEHSLAWMAKRPGLYGSRGVVFPCGDRTGAVGFGWEWPSIEPVAVDLVGHSWLFRREWLAHYVAEPRPTDAATAGEDYHWSVALQKRAGLPVYAAPHPPKDRACWGSTDPHLGSDRQALHHRPGEDARKSRIHQWYRDHGWKTLYDLEQEHRA
jgi:hypothetical protein